MIKTMQKIIYSLLFLLVSQLAQAKLEIEIIQGNASALPIAIIPMQWRAADTPPETGVSEIVSSDLYRSGLFDPLDEQDMVDRPIDDAGASHRVRPANPPDRSQRSPRSRASLVTR